MVFTWAPELLPTELDNSFQEVDIDHPNEVPIVDPSDIHTFKRVCLCVGIAFVILFVITLVQFWKYPV